MITKRYKSTTYGVQKFAAQRRGIEFQLSFDEWWGIWERSGKYEQRGRLKHQYCMSRFNDEGPYAVGNVEIITVAANRAAQKKGNQHYNQGSKSALAKLTESDVKLIRSEYQRGKRGKGQYSTAKKFGVSERTINRIVNNKSWTHC